MIHIKPLNCIRRCCKSGPVRSSIITSVLGGFLLVFLYILVSFEPVDESIYFKSLPIPERPDLRLFGISHVEDLPTTGTHRIPRRIHQTWKTDQIPYSLIGWIKSWTKHHPDWEYWLWTDSSARKLIQDKFPNLLPIYDSYPQNIQRADALRYVVLHEFGGVYADLDMESLKPLDPLTFRYACFVGQEPYVHPIMDTNTETLVINAFMACRPAHPFMRAVVDSLPDFAHMWSLLDSTGPHFLSYVFKKYVREHPQYPQDHENGTYLAPAEYFYPNSDPDKFWYMYRRCKLYADLNELQKRACQSLKITAPLSERLSLAFTSHHWIHTYLTVKVSLRQPEPIQKIVPSVQIYS